MTPDADTIARLEQALEDARSGALQVVMVAGISAHGYGLLYSSMDADDALESLDWIEAALSEPAGEVFTYAVH